MQGSCDLIDRVDSHTHYHFTINCFDAGALKEFSQRFCFDSQQFAYMHVLSFAFSAFLFDLRKQTHLMRKLLGQCWLLLFRLRSKYNKQNNKTTPHIPVKPKSYYPVHSENRILFAICV